MAELEEVLGNFLEKKANSSWDKNKVPYFLSYLPPEFKEEEKRDYKEVIGEERLKSAVKRLSEKYKFLLVEHPTIKAKVGIVPKGETFEFPEEKVLKKSVVKMELDSVDERRRIVIEFFDLLGRLPPDFLAEVSIPARVISRLISRS